MDQKEDKNKEIENKLSDVDTTTKVDLINNLAFEDVDDHIVGLIVKALTDENKAIRNAASNFLTYNRNINIPDYVVGYISSQEISLRNLAGEILIKKDRQAVDSILTYLASSSNDDDIKFLIDILGLIGDRKAEDLIINILETNNNENVIVACIEALGNFLSEKAIDKIIPFYDKSEVLKPVVIEAIGKIRHPKSIEFIIDHFDTDDDLQRFTIIESLGEIGTENAFYFLLSNMEQLTETLSWQLLESIYKLKLKYNLEIPFDEKMKKCLLDTILNAEPRHKITAAHLASAFNDKDILLACLNIYGIDQELDEKLYKEFLDNKYLILSKINDYINNDNKFLLELLKLLQSIIESDPHLMDSLSVIEKRKLIESISECLTNPDEIVRILTAEIMFKIDQEGAILFLDTMSSDENFWNRIRLLDLIGEIEDTSVMKAIEKLSNDPEEMVSEKAKEILHNNDFFISNI